MALIEIDGLPNWKMVDLSMAMWNNQRVFFKQVLEPFPSRWYEIAPKAGNEKVQYSTTDFWNFLNIRDMGH